MLKFDKIKTYILANKTKLWKGSTILSIVLFIIAIIFTVNLLTTKENKSNIKQIDIYLSDQKEEKEEELLYMKKCEGCVRRKLDGVYVKEAVANLEPVAIMIDNHVNARPPYGIEKANLVYEAEVEGKFTRYMTVFSSDEEIERIGPVRSARPYFVELAQELDAVYSHCGGSPEALVNIVQKDIKDMNQFYTGDYFWRSTDRSAPHNIFTSTEKLKKYKEDKNFKEGDYLSWKFKNDKENINIVHSEIAVNFNHPSFRVKWKYNEVNNDYTRYLINKPHLTGDNNIISAKNIVIQYIPAKVIDDKLRLSMNVIGDGEAIFCFDGECKKGKWEKLGNKSRTKYFYEDDKEVEFNAGTTWVEIVRPEVEIKY